MNKKEKEDLKDLRDYAKHIHLDKFKFNGKFITIDMANRMLKKK